MDKFIRVDDYLSPNTWIALLNFFEQVWERSQEDPELRKMTI